MIAEYLVSGMSCEHCVNSVTGEIRALPGVSGVDVELATGRVTVTSTSALSFDEVGRAIDEAGYELVDSAPTDAR